MCSLPSAATTVRDILCFHKLDRSVYDRLLSLGMQPVTARNVTALWMWLEIIGIDVIANVRDNRDPAVVASFAAEAELILDCIRQDAPAVNDAAVAAIPVTAGLVDEPLTLRFFHAHRDVAVRGITNILDGVGAVIFDDRLNALMGAQEVAARAADEGGYRTPAVPVELCAVYRPRLVHASEDRRSMFVTFSKGYPLRREDIMEYFTEYKMGRLCGESDDGEDCRRDVADVRKDRVQERVLYRACAKWGTAREVCDKRKTMLGTRIRA